MLQSVTRVQHGSTAKWRIFWDVLTGQSVVTGLLTAEGSSEERERERVCVCVCVCVCGEDDVDVSSGGESAHEGVKCYSGVDCSYSSSRHPRFSTLRIPCVWPP